MTKRPPIEPTGRSLPGDYAPTWVEVIGLILLCIAVGFMFFIFGIVCNYYWPDVFGWLFITP